MKAFWAWIVAGVYIVDPERAHPGHLCHVFARLRPMEVRRVPWQYDNRPWWVRSASVRPLLGYDAGRVGSEGRTSGNSVDATRDASSGAYPPECSRECANVATKRASVKKIDCDGRAPLSA
jgi:hypothetical protein